MHQAQGEERAGTSGAAFVAHVLHAVWLVWTAVRCFPAHVMIRHPLIGMRHDNRHPEAQHCRNHLGALQRAQFYYMNNPQDCWEVSVVQRTGVQA